MQRNAHAAQRLSLSVLNRIVRVRVSKAAPRPTYVPPPPAPARPPARPPAPMSSSLDVGQRVLVRGVFPGVVRFVGEVGYAKGEFVGVELDDPKGKNDGEVKGVRYFSCPKNHGLLARPYDVEPTDAPGGSASLPAVDDDDDDDDDDDAPSLPQAMGAAEPARPHDGNHGHSHGGQPCHGHSHGAPGGGGGGGELRAHLHPDSPPKLSAEAIRKMGNDYFSRKEYKTALGFYNRSVLIGDDATRHLSLGNRAITKINLKDYMGAVADCDAALALRPDYVKCYIRKGMAYRHMNRLEEAFATLEEGMQHAPHDAGIQKEMSRVIKHMEQQMAQLQGGMGGMGSMGDMGGMGGIGDMGGIGGMGMGDMGGMGGMDMAAAMGGEGGGGAQQQKKKPVKVNRALIGRLQDAARRNAVDDVRRLLVAEGADVNAKDGHDMVALEWASKAGNLEVVQLLLDHKAAVDPVDDEAGSAVLSAAASGHLPVLKALLAAGGSVRVQGSILGHSALHRACDGGHADVVEFLLAECPELLIQPDGRGYTPVAVAASKGHLDLVRRLLECKADLATTAAAGSGPLALAVKANHADVARFLLAQAGAESRKGAVVDARVVYNAVAHADDDVLTLVEPGGGGADVATAAAADQGPAVSPDCKGRSVLHLAAHERNEEATEYLLQAPWGLAALNALDVDGETPVITATRRGAFSVLKRLVGAKADVNVAEPAKGKTALHIAGDESMDPVYDFLVRHGASTTLRDAKGAAPELKEKKNCVVM